MDGCARARVDSRCAGAVRRAAGACVINQSACVYVCVCARVLAAICPLCCAVLMMLVECAMCILWAVTRSQTKRAQSNMTWRVRALSVIVPV
jgi:hypothetical protein